jgi:hypothetical protein
MWRLLTLMLVLSLLRIYALFRRGQSCDRVSQPELKPRRGMCHIAQSALQVLAAAFLWRTVQGRLRPGRVPWFPVCDPCTVCHPFVSQRWMAFLNQTKEIRKMACPPFKPVRHRGRLFCPANYLGGIRDV